MDSYIKTLYLLHVSNKHEGANLSFLSMLDGLIVKGINPLVILPREGDLCKELTSRQVGFFIVRYYMDKLPALNGIRDYVLLFPRLITILLTNCIAFYRIRKLVRQFNPHLIHTNVGPLLLGSRLSASFRLPHVWHIREYQDLDFNMKTLYSKDLFKRRLRESRVRPIAITKGIFNHFSMGSNATVIYNGVLKQDQVRFNPEKKQYFLFVGRLTENKGVRDLIVAFATFVKTHPNYELRIVGEAKDFFYGRLLRELVNELGAQDAIQFLGKRNDVYDLMETAAALVVPSFNEGFGRITAEAMFCGCLVIGYNSAGTREILEEHHLGLLYVDIQGLISCMDQVAFNGISYYGDMIMSAQKYASELYSQEQNVAKVWDVYSDALLSG